MNGHCLFDTALGTCAIAWTDKGIRALALPDSSPALTLKRLAEQTHTAYAEPPREVIKVIAMVTRHLTGRPIEFDSVRVDLSGAAPFDRTVWEAVREVKAGQVVTYGELARRIGKPHAARAVAAALGRNPIPLIIPCHRVVSKGGKLGGFSAPGGVETKRRLLALEIPAMFVSPGSSQGATPESAAH